MRPDGADACLMVSRVALDYRGEKAIIASFVDITIACAPRPSCGGQGSRRIGEPGQIVVSRQYEPRIAHAAQRHHRLQRNSAEDAADRGDKASMGDLEKIQAAGKHLLGLINDILDLSKIEAGRMDVYLEHVFLSRLVDEVKTIVEPMVKKNGNTLVIECPPDIGSLQTDLTKLKQSIINLLSNAAKFTKDGKVTLRLSRDRTDETATPWVKFEVIDSGIGMTEEQMGRLFQAFTQADSSTTRNFGGTGLGLTITKHFCAMLGGSIDVEEHAGPGLDLHDPAAGPRDQSGDGRRPGSRQRSAAVVHEPSVGRHQRARRRRRSRRSRRACRDARQGGLSDHPRQGRHRSARISCAPTRPISSPSTS